MKIIKIIFFGFLALSLIAGMAVFIFFETFDADQYLPQIAQKVSLALGRPVSIAAVGLGLSLQGITLDAGPLTIADDQSFTTQPFIKVDRVRVRLDLRKLILRREIHITKIILQFPQIHFIRSRQGNVNASSFGKAAAVKKPDRDLIASWSLGEEAKQTFNSKGMASSPQNAPGKDTVKNGIDIESIQIQDASISFIDQNQAMPLDIWLSSIQARLNDFSLSQPFHLSFDASLYSHHPNVHADAVVFFDPLRRSVRVSDLDLRADLSQVDTQQLKYISPGLPDSPFLKDISGAVELKMARLEIGASGDVEANGNIVITGVVIRNVNIVKTVLSGTLGAFMDGNIDHLLNGPLGAKDTVIEKAEAGFSVHDKAVFIDHSSVKTNMFEFTATGSMDQGLNMDMQTMLYLNGDVSSVLVSEFAGFKALYDDSNRIAVDASLKGVVPHLKYKPNKDFRKKSRKVLMEEGGNILGVLLGVGPSAQDQGSGPKLKKNLKGLFKNFLQ